MTLEEIFVANVQSRRDHPVAVSETTESVTA
jgi:hypothetical protein